MKLVPAEPECNYTTARTYISVCSMVQCSTIALGLSSAALVLQYSAMLTQKYHTLNCNS